MQAMPGVERDVSKDCKFRIDLLLGDPVGTQPGGYGLWENRRQPREGIRSGVLLGGDSGSKNEGVFESFGTEG